MKSEIIKTECIFCGYQEPSGNLLLECGKHYICDECLLSGEALDHDCEKSAS
jgi:hypothetical protein